MKQKLTRLGLATFCVLTASCAAADEVPPNGIDILGKATLTLNEKWARPCEEIFILPATNAISLRDAIGSRLQMDWSFYNRLRELRAAAVSVGSCGPDGSFEFHGVAGDKIIVVAHFTWLRGKWSTGGTLIREISAPLTAPIDLHANLDG